jgi:TolB-like protein
VHEEIPAGAVRDELSRVLQSRAFSGAPSLSRLLTHVVERTLDGKGDDLKEYSLGVDVFDRGDSFDPKVDTIVRVQARRLRAKLHEYYQSEGREDPIAIVLAKGRYAPEFERAQKRPTERSIPKVPVAAASLGVAAIVVLGLVTAVLLWRQRPSAAAAAPNIKSVAVLPLVNLSNDPDQEYFAEGMTEALITDLGQASSLRVISHTSVNRYKGTTVAIPQIARELDVDAVVEGTVTRSGDRLRITANLIQVSPERHLWAETFESDPRDILKTQSEVASTIAGAVRVMSTRPVDRAWLKSVNFEAYREYLAGRYFYERFSVTGMEKAFEHLDRAIQLDPGFPLPYAIKAQAYIPLVSWGVTPAQAALAKAEAAARQALAQDADLAEAHTALGGVHVMRTEWTEAAREFKAAIAANPNYYIAHDWYAQMLTETGDFARGLDEYKLASRLDPLNEGAHKSLGFIYYVRGQYDEAVREEKEALRLDPTFFTAHAVLGGTYERQGDYQAAVAEFQQTGASLFMAHAYALSGKTREARRILHDYQQNGFLGHVSHAGIAYVYMGLGEHQAAIEELEKADREGEALDSINIDPNLAPLRHNARFVALLRRHGFAS